MALLVERSRLTPEIHGRIQALTNFYRTYVFVNYLCWKDENKEKEAWNGPFKKIQIFIDIAYLHFSSGVSLSHWMLFQSIDWKVKENPELVKKFDKQSYSILGTQSMFKLGLGNEELDARLARWRKLAARLGK